MAKYDVQYKCGHGNYTVELFGKQTERDRKLDWFARGNAKLCPDCYKKEMAKQNAETGIQGEIIINPYINGAAIVINIGDTFSIKDKLKELGFRWGDYSTDFLGLHSKKAWQYNIATMSEIKNETVNQQKIDAIIEKLKKIGVSKINIPANNPLMQMEMQAAFKATDKQRALALLKLGKGKMLMTAKYEIKQERNDTLEDCYKKVMKLTGMPLATSEKLLAYLGSIELIKEAANHYPKQFAKIPGIGDKLALKISENVKKFK